MKGALKKLLTSLLLILFLCSFSLNAYAASDFYDPDLYNYPDSFLDDSNDEDKLLMFFPMIPDSKYSDYIIAYSKSSDCYLLYLIKDKVFGHVEFFGGWLEVWGYDLYKYNSKYSNNWEVIQKNISFYQSAEKYSFPDLVFIDATCNVVKFSTAAGGWLEINYTAHTGYRVYWYLTVIYKQILAFLQTISNYILERPLLRISFMVFFAGEVFVFAVMLIRRIGALRNESSA